MSAMIPACERARQELYRLLGGWPDPCPQAAHEQHQLQAVETITQNGMVVERLLMPCTRRTARAPDRAVPALLCKPSGPGPYPVVLYCHAHGNNYAVGKQELLDGRPALREGPYAPALVARGIAAFAIDLPCFGERRTCTESALSKSLLWHGDTLFGTMLRELCSALDYLQCRDDIDTRRLLAYGISMGATLSWWLAALDERVTAVAEICCLADLHTLVEQGAHDVHGIYMTVPGLLARFTTADIASLIVPRPHFCAVGECDALTPLEAFSKVASSLQRAYQIAGVPDAWQVLADPQSAHVETAQMRRRTLDFVQRQLCR